MENNFLKLHKSDDNSTALVNITQIEQIYKSSNYNDTCIVMINNDDDLHVNESAERIYNTICKMCDGGPVTDSGQDKKTQLLNEDGQKKE